MALVVILARTLFILLLFFPFVPEPAAHLAQIPSIYVFPPTPPPTPPNPQPPPPFYWWLLLLLASSCAKHTCNISLLWSPQPSFCHISKTRAVHRLAHATPSLFSLEVPNRSFWRARSSIFPLGEPVMEVISPNAFIEPRRIKTQAVNLVLTSTPFFHGVPPCTVWPLMFEKDVLLFPQ